MWFWLTLVATFCFALGHILVKKGYEHLSAGQTKILDVLFYLLIFVPYALIKGGISFAHWPIILILGAVVGFNYYFRLKGLTKGKISLVSTVYATSPIFVLILAAVFLKEQLSSLQIILLLIIVGGVLILSIPADWRKSLRYVSVEKWIFWGLLGALLMSINDVAAKKAVDLTSVGTVMFLFPLIDVPVGLIILKLEKKPLPFSKWSTSYITGLGVLINNLGAICFFEAIARGKVSLISGILASVSVLTAILAYLLLKEKISRWQLAGIILVAASVFMLGLAAG